MSAVCAAALSTTGTTIAVMVVVLRICEFLRFSEAIRDQADQRFRTVGRTWKGDYFCDGRMHS
jgi:hypothetical protein